MKDELFIWFMTTARWRAGVPQFFYNSDYETNRKIYR